MYDHMFVCMYMYVCIYVCMYVCMHACIYITYVCSSTIVDVYTNTLHTVISKHFVQ